MTTVPTHVNHYNVCKNCLNQYLPFLVQDIPLNSATSHCNQVVQVYWLGVLSQPWNEMEGSFSSLVGAPLLIKKQD
jgi:hypothetical protein